MKRRGKGAPNGGSGGERLRIRGDDIWMGLCVNGDNGDIAVAARSDNKVRAVHGKYCCNDSRLQIMKEGYGVRY
jgi:hypothetical protein